MAIREVLHGLGQGLVAVGQGLGQIEQQNAAKKQQEFENKLLTRREDLAKEQFAWQKAVDVFTSEVTNYEVSRRDAEFDFTQSEAERQSQEKALDRFLTQETARNDAILRLYMMYEQHGLDKNTAAFAEGLRRETLERTSMVEVMQRARAQGMDILGEQAKGMMIYLNMMPRAPGAEKARNL